MVCAILIAIPSHAQNFINRLGNAAKNAVERNVTNKVEEGVDKAFDANSYKNNNEKTNTNNNKEQAANGWQCPQCGTSGITGKFCPNTGSDKVNDPLSQKRAEAIVAALVEQGINASRLTAVSKGSHSPIADNATEEGRAKNRRVEFIKK